MKAETRFSLKDELFNAETVGQLALWLANGHPAFNAAAFTKQVLAEFPNLELKARIAHIAEVLAGHLPSDFAAAAAIIVDSLPPPLDPAKTDDDFGEYIIAALSQYVAQRGATEQNLKTALDTLRQITMRFSAEDAIRTFINTFPDRTLAFLLACAGDDNYHVRRLASEGTRPTLPWSAKINIDHTDPLPILDELFNDPTRYVTRSVANHLNDIAKIDSDLVITTLRRWKKTGQQGSAEMDFIIEHSCRTLVKKGDPAALKLLGYGAAPDLSISEFETSTPTVEIGTAFEFSLALRANRDQRLMVDYTMTFAGADGSPGASKVFKLKRLQVKAGDVINLKKKHPMRLMTTRALFAGTHTITMQINGHQLDQLSFNLTT